MTINTDCLFLVHDRPSQVSSVMKSYRSVSLQGHDFRWAVMQKLAAFESRLNATICYYIALPTSVMEPQSHGRNMTVWLGHKFNSMFCLPPVLTNFLLIVCPEKLWLTSIRTCWSSILLAPNTRAIQRILTLLHVWHSFSNVFFNTKQIFICPSGIPRHYAWPSVID